MTKYRSHGSVVTVKVSGDELIEPTFLACARDVETATLIAEALNAYNRRSSEPGPGDTAR